MSVQQDDAKVDELRNLSNVLQNTEHKRNFDKVQYWVIALYESHIFDSIKGVRVPVDDIRYLQYTINTMNCPGVFLCSGINDYIPVLSLQGRDLRDAAQHIEELVDAYIEHAKAMIEARAQEESM